MLSKYFIVFLFSLSLYSVQCSDITINIIDDGEIQSSHSLDNCNPSACDQLCRILGFTRGECIQGKCYCNNFKPNQDPVMNLFKSVESCNFAACDQLCRRLGFPGGACVGDRCKCDNFKKMAQYEYVIDNDVNKDEEEQHAVILKEQPRVTVPKSCDAVWCDDICHKFHYTGGMCIDGNCQCYN